MGGGQPEATDLVRILGEKDMTTWPEGMKEAGERVRSASGEPGPIGLHAVISEWVRSLFPASHQGKAVEVGASNGVFESNTFFLENLHRWTCLCIEPNPDFYENLRMRRVFTVQAACDAPGCPTEGDFHVHVTDPFAFSALRRTPHPIWFPEKGAKWKTVRVPIRTLDSILESCEFGDFDFLSVDVEGTELDVLKGLDLEKYRPRVLAIEAWDEDNQIVPYLAERGYKRTGRALVNDLYERAG